MNLLSETVSKVYVNQVIKLYFLGDLYGVYTFLVRGK